MISCRIHRLVLEPPLLNSSSFWASSCQQLEELYASRFTGGVTTRTATISGFAEDPAIHKHALVQKDASINSYGYSPYPLSQYIAWIRTLLTHSTSRGLKPVIISLAPASPGELSVMLDSIQELRRELHDAAHPDTSRVGVELNTSCPNIPGYPPPAYDPPSLLPLLGVFRDYFTRDSTLTIGLKLAPFVHAGEFQRVVELLAGISTTESASGRQTNCISFLTCTNTLGSSIVFQDQTVPRLDSGAGVSSPFAVPTATGGLAGEPIHALSLGNVYSFRKLLSGHPDPSLQQMAIIGVGGVASREAVRRMRGVGASAVACATALGTYGLDVFEKLIEGVDEKSDSLPKAHSGL